MVSWLVLLQDSGICLVVEIIFILPTVLQSVVDDNEASYPPHSVLLQTLSSPPLPSIFLSPTFCPLLSSLPLLYHLILPSLDPLSLFTLSPLLPSILPFSALSILCLLLLSPLPLLPFSSQTTSPSQLLSETNCK